ncbi:MAG: tRNA lysidine(34) synthetase TilS [Planctomycetota bacterium]|nr:tRNA lysidine(34) synthetase TilS [Planctomycetota bacterium]
MIEELRGQLQSLMPFAQNAKVLLACSGGADSTFLAHAYQKIAADTDLPPAVVAVVDHGQQANSAEFTANVVRGFQNAGFEVCSKRIELGSKSSENQMREGRYAALIEMATTNAATHILFAHHADDVAETVLQRIMRGTGINGLAGIRSSRQLAPQIQLFRPLLRMRRQQIINYLRENEVPWHEDLSNFNIEYATRNKIRHHLLPQLSEVATGDPSLALIKLATEAQDWQQGVEDLLDQDIPFKVLPSYFRRQALRRELINCGETVSPQRLSDLEGALLKKGSATINAALRFSTSGGKLLVVSRR